MIRANRHIIIFPLFKWLSRFMINRNFCATHIEGAFNDNGHPVLMVANHISWWDGLWEEYLNLLVTIISAYIELNQYEEAKNIV